MRAGNSALFQPIKLGANLVLNSRTWVPAMVPWRATEQGEVTERLLQWYGRFAEGQPGVIVVEATGIRDIPSGPLLRIAHDRDVDGLAQIVDRVKKRSAGESKIFIQIIDFLAVKRRPTPARFFAHYLEVSSRHRNRLCEILEDDANHSLSDEKFREKCSALSVDQWAQLLNKREFEALQFGYRERVTDTHLSHIKDLPKRLPPLFAAAAKRAERAGFDGVELHFAHAYTMASFLSAKNDRDDGFGGSFEGRVRLPLEVYAATRASLANDTVLGCRYLNDEVIEGGSTVDHAIDYGVAFAKAGMDYLSLSRGGKFEDAKQPRIGEAIYPYTGPSGHECMPTIYSDAAGPFGRQLALTRKIRDAVRSAGFDTPIVAAGGINTFEMAMFALESGAADIIAAARQTLADPDWFKKMRMGLGSEIRRCKMTNYCEGLDQRHKQVSCQLWDRHDLNEEGLMKSHDHKRRLVAPPWLSQSSKPK